MKIHELENYHIPLTNEESSLLDDALPADTTAVPWSKLTPRERVIADQLVVKGVLKRKRQNGQVAYVRPA